MTMISPDDGRPSVSRTARYKKVTKPLLERKRRARINRCLDELKDLMVGAFEVEGDNISKLEKADILELTVRHLTKLHSPRDPIADAKRFQAGFGQCAAEACQFILSMPDVDTQIGQNLVQHLSSQINEGPLSVQVPAGRNFSPPVSPEAPTVWSSPLIKEDPEGFNNLKEQINRAIPDNYHKQIRGENLSHVPVNQSLVCDIATLNSSPTVHEISQPLAGLLMTVDTQQGINHNSRHPEHVIIKNNVENGRICRESDMIQNAKAKNIIIKKIREQILERQVKESEPKASLSNSSRELPSHVNIEDQYQPSLYDTVPTKRAYKRKHEKVDVHNNSTDTIDLRKKSKGESKHFSPAMIDVVNSNYECFQNAAHSMGRFSNPIQGNPNQEDLNNPKYHPKDPRKYNYYEDQVTVTKVNKPVVEINRSHLEENYITQKRQADYRNIHPKKAIIRPLKYTEEQEINLAPETSRQYRTPVENFEQPSRSSLRDQRFSNAPSHPDNVSRYHQAAREFRTDERQYRKVSLDYEQMSKYSNIRPSQEQYQRYRQGDGIDQEYMRPYDPNQEQEDDENMWRPW